MPAVPTLSLVVLISSFLFTLISRQSSQATEALTGPASGIHNDYSRILLLSAHPDDECMFFAPTLLGLLAQGTASVDGRRPPEVFSLCLSVGNADGLGNMRRDELGRSLDVLGVPSSRRWVEDRSDLQDNFTAQWDYDTVADVVRPYVLENRITTILTFDAYGISGHPNHISLCHGAARLLSSFPSSSDSDDSALARPRLFTLVSVPLVWKYTGPASPLLLKASSAMSDALRTLRLAPAEAPIPPARSSEEGRTQSRAGKGRGGVGDMGVRRGPAFVAGVREYVTALRAMMQHRSQLVWFRWLYVAFSRYMWVNEWVEVVVSPDSADSAPSS